MTEADKVIIDGCAMAIMSGTLDANEIQSNAEQIHNRIGGVEVNPTTSVLAEEIRRANEIYMLDSNLLTVAADRLESQEREIEQLKNQIDLQSRICKVCDQKLTARAEQAERERDSFIEKIRGRCSECEYESLTSIDEPCASCHMKNGYPNWTWRGLPQDGEGK